MPHLRRDAKQINQEANAKDAPGEDVKDSPPSLAEIKLVNS
jgi:hypothetical protein